ncbi:Gp49 family protein [Ramlibacter sp.]|uniref:Gp49 family protein n=1 Tax=Ramlibacter sp. TaxID=1917967 RepID=UPI003D0ECAE0
MNLQDAITARELEILRLTVQRLRPVKLGAAIVVTHRPKPRTALVGFLAFDIPQPAAQPAQPERQSMNHIASPDSTDRGIEAAIVAAGKTAPRVTPADIEANIESWWYFTAAEGAEGAAQAGTPHSEQPPVGAASPLRLLTFCVLVLKNGFTVTGESACASPENYDRDIGRRIARENAINKVWPLMGYALREKLHAARVEV